SSWHVADDIVTYSKANNVTQIIIGKSERPRWFEILNGSVVHDLLRRSGNIRVQVICGEDIPGDPIPKKTVRTAEAPRSLDPIPYAVGLAGVGAALAVAWVLRPWLGVESVDLVFLVPIIGTAVGYGLAPSLVASVAASLCYNFFFLPPLFTFTISDGPN